MRNIPTIFQMVTLHFFTGLRYVDFEKFKIGGIYGSRSSGANRLFHKFLVDELRQSGR